MIGAGEPALPGISIGHNGHIAFGLTIFPIDQEDLYVYRTNPDTPEEYRYGDRWVPMRVVRETVGVAGAEPVEVELKFTRHGPVVYEDPVRHTAFAVRAAWLEPGMAPYLGSMDYMGVRTTGEFVDAMNRWGAPGEWAGFHDADELPFVENPPEDWIATANETNLPAEALPVSYDSDHRFRYDRIAEVLREARGLTVADCVALQADTVNRVASEVLRALDDYVPDHKTAAAVRLLRAWDHNESRDSAAAALFQVWSRRHLRPALLSRVLAEVADPAATRRLPSDELLGSDVRTDLKLLTGELDQVLSGTLVEAWRECEDLMGEDWSAWTWGRLHHAAPAHPFADVLDHSWTRLPRRSRPGSGDTVMCAAYDETFRQEDGASFRIVVDVGDWDRSRAMNAPGQSGRPEDPHWDDLYESWAADGSFTLYYSRAAVEAHTQTRHTFSPAPGATSSHEFVGAVGDLE